MNKFSFLLLISLSFFAQTKGIVVDESGKPIPYVNIWVENENIGTTSEENGQFSIITGENKILVFSAIGFETLKSKLNESGKVVLKPIVYQIQGFFLFLMMKVFNCLILK